MNHLILNRDFQLPDDGWYQIAPLGEFAHAGAGLIQVIDPEACVAMAGRFAADAKIPNFAGLLVDFDHFSMDGEKRSEAAGWIVDLEVRGKKADGSVASDASDNKDWGLWGKIQWSDLGEAAVKGGRYRFLSPVWARTDCVDLGPDSRLRVYCCLTVWGLKCVFELKVIFTWGVDYGWFQTWRVGKS
jgi:phage I-like protein